MGYRSSVALTLYGTPEKVDMVDMLLLQKLSPEYDRGMFEATKQVRDDSDGERCILWTFDDIKWYSEFDAYKDDVFSWVEQMMDEEPDHERNWRLAAEFVRVGEENTDVEESYTGHADYRLYVTRSISIPENFEWRA